MIKSQKRASIGRPRKTLLPAVYVLCAAGIGVLLGAAPAGGTGGAGGTGTGPGTRVVSPADKAAADAQVDKAKALYSQNHFAEAQVENDKALKLDPTNVDANLLKEVLKSKLASGPVLTTPIATSPVTQAAGKIPVLTLQQVSLIRLMELGPNDRPLGRIEPKVLEDFWKNVVVASPEADKSAAAQRAFLSPANFGNQVRRIRDAGDMQYMQQVTINNDPATIAAYRTNVQPYVLQSCATADCHGGERSPGGNFRLLISVTNAEQQYTNYYILSQYANKDGQLIDRDTPDKSLLLQYALPWATASVKHPKIDVKRLSGVTDPRGRTIEEWIGSLPIPKPAYGISYMVPGMASPATATAPATAAATTTRVSAPK